VEVVLLLLILFERPLPVTPRPEVEELATDLLGPSRGVMREQRKVGLGLCRLAVTGGGLVNFGGCGKIAHVDVSLGLGVKGKRIESREMSIKDWEITT
jgi:hypothetical protein